MKIVVSAKGQIVIPAEIRQQDEIEPGQEFELQRVGRGEYLLRRLSPPPNPGLLDWLLACPEKGGLSTRYSLRSRSTFSTASRKNRLRACGRQDRTST